MQAKQVQKRSHFKLLIGVLAVLTLTLVLTAYFIGGNKETKDAGNVPSENVSASKADEKPNEAQGTEEGEDLIIPIGEISESAKFYSVEVDGTAMEVIAVKAPDGTIRTAFNTCQVCYDSGRGYYKQSGDKLVCQNCGNQFPMNNVEIEAGGCNPWPIFAKDKTVTDESITIPYDFLKESKEIFANWKVL